MSTTRSADTDERVAGALTARRRMSDAFRAHDPDVLHDAPTSRSSTRGDLVVIMGANAGSSVHRRFTDMWRPHQDAWQLAIRQVTITSLDRS